jgi:D-glycero-D-manno-heptose 1,7-bisphosphate phosphatase
MRSGRIIRNSRRTIRRAKLEGVERDMGIRHVILDRDGVLNQESDEFIAGPDAWKWLPGSLEALALLTRAGVRLSVATNQASVGRGHLRPDTLEAIHARMTREAREAGGTIDAIFVCPHAPAEACGCRKPAPGLVQAAMALARIPARETLLVGDDGRDIEAALAAGVEAVLVLTGKGCQVARSPALRNTRIYADILALAQALAREPRAGWCAS